MLFDTVLLEEIKEESAVVIAGEDKKDTAIGKVLAIGEGQAYGLPAFRPTTVKVGDIVRFLKSGASKVKEDGKELWCSRERDLLYVR